MADICLIHNVSFEYRCRSALEYTYVYLGILKTLLQIVVDGFIGDFAEQSEIRDADLLLL